MVLQGIGGFGLVIVDDLLIVMGQDVEIGLVVLINQGVQFVLIFKDM